MDESVTDRWSRLREALNRKLPDWLDLPLRGCCLVSDCLTVLGLLGGVVWLVTRLVRRLW